MFKILIRKGNANQKNTEIHLTLVSMAIIKKINSNSCWYRHGECGRRKEHYNPGYISFLGIYLKEFKSTYNCDNCTPMFIAALFTIPKLWNEPNMPINQ
jgi:hypothetical protein